MSSSWHPDESQLAAYMAGGADTPADARVSEHLAECPSCQSEVAKMQHAVAAYREWTRATLPPPPAPWRSLAGDIVELDEARRERWWHILSGSGLRWAAGLAAVLIAVL